MKEVKLSRTNLTLAIVLGLQFVVLLVVFWPRPASGVGGEPLFPGLQADQVVGLTIQDDQGARIVLARRVGAWVLPEAGDYPTREGAVPELLEQIVELNTGRLVAQTPASHERLQVSDGAYVRLVELELADGTVHKLYLGSTPSYSVIHVRADGQDEVYLAPGLSSADIGAQAGSWVDTLYFSVPQDQVAAITLENANGMFEFRKGEDGTWTMAGLEADETLNEGAVTSLVGRAASLRMLEPLGQEEEDAYGLDDANAVILIQAQDEQGKSTPYELYVGAAIEGDREGDMSYVVKSSESPYYVRVAGYTAGDWVDKTREGFLELPPTPTPAPTPPPG